MHDSQRAETLKQLLEQKLENHFESCSIELGDLVLRVDRAALFDFMSAIKLDAELDFNMLLDVTAVDWMDEQDDRFEVVYHLRSIGKKHFLRVKVWVPESDAKIHSLVDLWPSANFLERETWDMYGIDFEKHPDQRRILMYDEFKGHPLRKDYPVQGKQPRIKLRSPEVQNTAKDMQRQPLVQINKISN